MKSKFIQPLIDFPISVITDEVENKSYTYQEFHNEILSVEYEFENQFIQKNSIVVIYGYRSYFNTLTLFFFCIKNDLIPFIIEQGNLSYIDGLNFNILITPEPLDFRKNIKIKESQFKFGKIYQNLHEDLYIGDSNNFAIVSSSGSTSKATKKILLGKEETLNNIISNQKPLALTKNDKTLVLLPISYSYGLIAQFFSHLFLGSDIVLTDKTLGILQIPSLIKKHAITNIFMTPLMSRLLFHYNKNIDAIENNLNFITIGGDKPNKQGIEKLQNIFKCPIYSTYGLAEAGPRVVTKKVNFKEVYYEQKEKLKEYVDEKWDNHELKNYHFLSANISRCLPNIPKEKHKSIYHNILSYRALQGIDTHFYHNFKSIKGVDTISQKIKKQKLPGIFVSFHLGSFRSTMAFLIQANLNVVLIIDPLPFQIQKEDIINQFKKIKSFFNSTSDLIIYPADKKDISIQILLKTKLNYSVLAFVDGNTGMNGAFNQKNSVKVNFLEQKVFFRKGLAMLSYYTKCPLIPILSYYDEDDFPHWEIKDSIIPTSELNAQDYVTNATIKIFKILEKALKTYPDQWEGWLYLHKFLEIEIKKDEKVLEYKNNIDQLEINPNIGLFAYDKKHYVLNKDTYTIIELSQDIFIKLYQNIFFDVTNEDIDNIIFLLKKNIIHLKSIKNATA